MNKFLELTFSIGKVFSSILLVIALFVMLWSGVGLLSSNNLSVKTPKFNTIKQAYIKESNESTYTANLDNSGSTESSNSFRYIRQIRKIIRKHQLKETLQYEIAKNIDNINEELIPEYLRGLDKFYTDGLKLIENSESFKDNFLYDVVYNEEKDGYEQVTDLSTREALNLLNEQDLKLTEYKRFHKNIDEVFSIVYNNLIAFSGKETEFESKLQCDFTGECNNTDVRIKFLDSKSENTAAEAKITDPETKLFNLLFDCEGGYQAGINYDYLVQNYSNNLSTPSVYINRQVFSDFGFFQQVLGIQFSATLFRVFFLLA